MLDKEEQSVSIKIKELATNIKERKLKQLAILILEAHKPINTFLYSIMLVSEPLLFFISGSKNWKLVKEIIRDKSLIEELLLELERV